MVIMFFSFTLQGIQDDLIAISIHVFIRLMYLRHMIDHNTAYILIYSFLICIDLLA